MRGRFVFAVAGFGLVAFRGVAEGAGTCPAPLGALVAIEGQVEFRDHPGAAWRAAPVNAPLCPGAMVRVGDRSRATATLPDAPTYRIDQNTTFHLVSAPARRERPAMIRLVEGALYIFSRRPRTLTVETPLVDAAVEGTEFLVRVGPSRATISVFEGTVTARNERGQAKAKAGQVAIAEAGRAPVTQLMIRPLDAVEWALHYPPILALLADPRAVAEPGVPQPVREAAKRTARGDIAGALGRLEAVPAGERRASFHLYRAAILLSVGRVEEARADIERALAKHPTAGLAYALKAVIAVAQNDNDAALAAGRRAVELEPASAAARIALSYAQQARFDLDGARESLRRAVEAEPKDALAWARLSELWLMAGRRDRARQAAETAADLSPDLARVQSVLGFAALAEFRAQTARKAFERALARDPADPTARFGLGLARIRRGDLEAGRNDIEAAVALDPNRSLLRSYLGKAYFEERTGNPLTYLRELAQNFPNQENTLAAEQFAIAKKLDPKDPTPFLYDAIRLQSENRPVEALRDLERSIELNDNRAVYRSRELLDQDRAARGTSLARIYNDLGFEQLGINEATRSLSLDPGSAAAHRFLSDSYLGRPRYEIARVSELLQAQLFQDININPVQPSLSQPNVGLITSGGPARLGFNEFTPLFERNQAQFNVSGLAGSHSTWGNEAVVSGLYDRFSISGGQFHYETDGFRRNFDLEHDIYAFFAQAAVTPELNVQAEVRTRNTEGGDPRLNFALGNYSPDLRLDSEQQTARTGVRFSPSPQSDLIGSFTYNDLNYKIQIPGSFGDLRNNRSAVQTEALYAYRGSMIDVVTGFGIFNIDYNIRRSLVGLSTPPGFRTSDGAQHQLAYIYTGTHLPKSITWTLGLSYDNYDQQGATPVTRNHVEKLSPKLGVLWNVSDHLVMRMAGFQTVKPATIVNQMIQPTQIAGFSQFFDDLDATTSRRYGVALDAQLAGALYGGAELSWRRLDVPLGSTTENWDESLYRTYLYYMPGNRWSVTAEPQLDMYDSHGDSILGVPGQVDTLSLPISLRGYARSGLFAGATGTYVHQEVNVAGSKRNSRFVVVDAISGLRLPQRRGFISVEVRNALDAGFNFQDDSFRSFAGVEVGSISPFFPERAVVARAALNF